MLKWRHKIKAKFCRSDNQEYIDVFFPNTSKNTALFGGMVGFCAKCLGDKELEEISITLNSQKEAMLKLSNFPPGYNMLLEELNEEQGNRYCEAFQKGLRKKGEENGNR